MRPALIIGNGPSVDLLEPEVLSRYDTFGVNHIYSKFNEWGKPVDNVVITDSNRIREIGLAYRDYVGELYVGNEHFISIPYRYTKRILGRDFTPLRQLTKKHMPNFWPFNKIPYSKYLYATVFDKWKMSFDLDQGLNFGRSVVISAIQIAAARGYRRICLTGVDSHYENPKDYFEGMENQIEYVNSNFIENPRLMMEPMLTILQIYLETMDVHLIDCTPGGHLKFIQKGNL